MKFRNPAVCPALQLSESKAMPAVGSRRWWLLTALFAALCGSPAAQARHEWRDGHHWRGERSDPALAKNNGFAVAISQTIVACAAQAPDLQKLRLEAVLKTAAPNDDQRAALEHLRAAAADAADKLKATCPKEVPAPLPDRLATMRASLDATTAALSPLRPGFVAASATLNDRQRARLVALSIRKAAAPDPKRDPNPDPKPRSKRGATRAKAAADNQSAPVSIGCGQWAVALKSWPLNRIKTRLSLSDAQRTDLNTLIAAVQRAAAAFAASCHDEKAATPVSHLDAALSRADALRQCGDAIAPPLASFVDSLNDEQHAQFNAALVIETP
jgi:hypothetical protein